MWENKYVFWAVTGAAGLVISMLIYLLKREIAKGDERIRVQEKHIDAVEDKLNKTISDMPFLYTLREDFIRSTANHDRKLDQIIALLTQTKGGNTNG